MTCRFYGGESDDKVLADEKSEIITHTRKSN